MSDSDRELTIPLKIDRSKAKQDLAAHEADARQSIDRIEAAEKQSGERRAQVSQSWLQKHKADLEQKKQAEKQTAAEIQAIEDQHFMAEYRRQGERIRREQEVILVRRRSTEETTLAGRAAQSLTGSLGGVATSMIGIGAAGAAFQTVIGVMSQAREKAAEMGREVLNMRQNLRALAAVSGGEPSNAMAVQTALFGAKTGLGVEGAKQYLEPFESRAGVVKGENLSTTEYEKYKLQSGALAQATGLPAEQAGEIYGGVLKSEKFDTAEQATARAGQVTNILATGTGRIAKLGPQMQKMVAQVSQNHLESAFRNSAEVAALVSTMAERDPEEAATLAERGTSGLRDFGNRDKAGFFKQAGITDQMSAVEAFRAANRAIGEQVQKGISVDTAIKGFGFSDVREQRALETAYINRDKAFEPQVAKAEAPLDIAGTQGTIANYQASDAGMYRRNLGMAESQQAITGAQQSAYQANLPAARAKLLKEGRLYGSWERTGYEMAAHVTGGDPEQAMIEAEAQRMQGIGMTSNPLAVAWGRVTGFGGIHENAVAAAGSANVPAALIEEQNRLMREQNDLMRAQGGRAVAPAPLPSSPPQMGR